MATTQLTESNTSKMVKTEKWNIHYNEAGSGYPVIMLHGSGPGATGWSNFNRNIGPLSEKYRVLLMDHPGWGKSDTVTLTDKTRGEVNAESVKLFMDALGIEKAALVGNSMGGGTALNFVLDYPDRISHLITMGSGGGGPSIYTPMPTEGLRILREGYEDPSVENFRKLISIMVYDSAFVTEELLLQRSEAALANRDHLENYLNAPANSYSREILSHLGKVTTPSLIIHGRDDRTVPFEGSLSLLAALPHCRLVVFSECGHWAQVEKADEFNRLVSDFLDHN